jgi:hypothetical protein
MKVLVRAYSGEYGNVDMALVDVNIPFILDLWAHWPTIPELTGLEFDSWSEWYPYDEALSEELELEGPMLNPPENLGEEERMDFERLIVRRDYCFWTAHPKYGDWNAETTTFHAEDLRKLIPVMDRVKEAIDNDGR